jgi:hypothetical protein
MWHPSTTELVAHAAQPAAYSSCRVSTSHLRLYALHQSHAMLPFLLGSAVIVLPRGNLALLAAIGAAKGAGECHPAAASRPLTVFWSACPLRMCMRADTRMLA